MAIIVHSFTIYRQQKCWTMTYINGILSLT